MPADRLPNALAGACAKPNVAAVDVQDGRALFTDPDGRQFVFLSGEAQPFRLTAGERRFAVWLTKPLLGDSGEQRG